MNQIKTLGLLSLLSALLVGIGYFIVGGTSGIIIGIVMAAVMNLGSWYFSDKIALSAYQAQPVSPEQAPELYQMLERLSQKANIPTPALYVVPGQAANAFATGRDPQHAAVAVTEGIVNMLTTDELEGVIAHELTHVINRDTLTQAVAATIAGAISQLAYMAQWASYGMAFGGSSDDRRGPNPIGLLLAMFLAPLAASLIQMTISRTREFEADAGAARLTNNPRGLASALQKLEVGAQRMSVQANPAFEPLLIINSFAGEGLTSLFSTHPPTQKRIERLLQLEQEMTSISAA
ncbi:MAG TPA: M48 family metalloprotease [Leptolyngbyaceae cyanobacterium M33_DOE_097]|uniref:Protease HtpX homolog n=1 Tax=Oscillatoriales cyanobacterium SpSt-418 TaxID=2282169 RepID=A0A7C3PQ74_9CYAN|nr:M48 family metalloprotease [Leptolyngbyaceae cyanobacterium M33_DOE_097]